MNKYRFWFFVILIGLGGVITLARAASAGNAVAVYALGILTTLFILVFVAALLTFFSYAQARIAERRFNNNLSENMSLLSQQANTLARLGNVQARALPSLPPGEPGEIVDLVEVDRAIFDVLDDETERG